LVKGKKVGRKKLKRVNKTKNLGFVPGDFKFERLEDDPIEQVKKMNVKPETVAKLMTKKESIDIDHCSQGWYCKQAKYCLVGLIVVLGVLAVVGMYNLNGTGNTVKSVGAFCLSDNQCEFACVNSECASGDSGNSCSTNRDCSNGQRCSTRGICGGPGAVCLNNGGCVSGICMGGFCLGTLESGRECTEDRDCKSGKCTAMGTNPGKYCK